MRKYIIPSLIALALFAIDCTLFLSFHLQPFLFLFPWTCIFMYYTCSPFAALPGILLACESELFYGTILPIWIYILPALGILVFMGQKLHEHAIYPLLIISLVTVGLIYFNFQGLPQLFPIFTYTVIKVFGTILIGILFSLKYKNQGA